MSSHLMKRCTRVIVVILIICREVSSPSFRDKLPTTCAPEEFLDEKNKCIPCNNVCVTCLFHENDCENCRKLCPGYLDDSQTKTAEENRISSTTPSLDHVISPWHYSMPIWLTCVIVICIVFVGLGIIIFCYCKRQKESRERAQPKATMKKQLNSLKSQKKHDSSDSCRKELDDMKANMRDVENRLTELENSGIACCELPGVNHDLKKLREMPRQLEEQGSQSIPAIFQLSGTGNREISSFLFSPRTCPQTTGNFQPVNDDDAELRVAENSRLLDGNVNQPDGNNTARMMREWPSSEIHQTETSIEATAATSL